MNDVSELRTIRAELDVRNLIAQVAQLADTGELSDYARCWTEEAAWEYPSSPVYGRDAILASATERRRTGTTGPGSHTRHMITTVRVLIEDADTATVDSCWLFIKANEGAHTTLAMGDYHDELRRSADGWQIARRQITLG